MPLHIDPNPSKTPLYSCQTTPRSMMKSLLRGGIIVALLVLHSVQASPVPGDRYPTVGLTLGGFTYNVNVTTYANVSADVRDIIRASPLFGADYGLFTDASNVYTLGKNSFRNQLASPTTLRIPKSAIDRAYVSAGPPQLAEAWYDLAALQFYSSLGQAYLHKYISDPLQGTFEFSKAAGGELASVREPIIDASILFYPVLYFYHEADAAWNALKRAALNINPAANLQSAADELEDAVGCILAPNVINGNTNERTAPGYNPWDVSNRVAKFFCTCTSASIQSQDVDTASSQGHSHKRSPHGNPPPYGSGNDNYEYQAGPPKDDYNYEQSGPAKSESMISVANRRFLDLAKRAQTLLRSAIASGGSVTPEAYGAIRIEMQQVLNINQIQLTLEAADKAFSSGVSEPCITQFARGATLEDTCGAIINGASAWAHWRMAMPALWYSKQTSVYKAKLLAVADLLHPTNWARITTEGALKHHHHSIVDAIHDVIVEAGYNWRDIINCGPPSY